MESVLLNIMGFPVKCSLSFIGLCKGVVIHKSKSLKICFLMYKHFQEDIFEGDANKRDDLRVIRVL